MEIENGEEATMVDSGGDFDCNICLDQVQDPVVTLCGHLFCWPCIYKWVYSTNSSRQRLGQYGKKESPRCPVCKSSVSDATIVPIYGRGRRTPCSGSNVPERPSGPTNDLGRVGRRLGESESQRYMYRMPDPVMGVVCEMVYRRLFGEPSSNVVAPYRSNGATSFRWRAMRAEESLSRVYLFLLCFMTMCLILF